MNLILLLLPLLPLLAVQKELKLFKKTIMQENSTCLSPEPNAPNELGLGNCNVLYYITLGIGTPPQYFDFQFDTGSPILWIPTIKTNSQGFDPDESSTYTITDEPYRIAYVDGSQAAGFVGEDVVALDGTPISARSDILFVEEEKNMQFPGNVRGLVGMGWSEIPNFLDNAYAAGQIETSTFSLQLHNDTQNSVVYYDEIPEDILENSTFCSRYGGDGFWEIELIGMYADDTDFTSYAATRAVIDSGTTLFYINPNLYNQISSTYLSGDECDLLDGIYFCDCKIQSSLPKLGFIFKGVEVYIYPEDYVVEAGQLCIVQINFINQEPEQILLGDTLFKNYIITFDKLNEQVGFNGDLLPIDSYGSDWFGSSQYGMMSLTIIWLLFGGFLLYHLRLTRISVSKAKNTEITMGMIK